MSQNEQPLTFTLKDGRKLGYSILAPANVTQHTPTVLYFHGWPGSHPEGGMIKTPAIQHRIRLITVSRPGFGDSSLKADRTHLDWADDVLEFVDSIGVQQFYVLGFSGGSPYTLACLASIPRERLLRGAIVSGAYPGCMKSKETILINRAVGIAVRTPILSSLLPYIVEFYVGREARDPKKAEQFEKRFVKDVGARHPKEAQSLENVEVRKAAVDSCRESFKQGSRGWACEAKLLNEDWKIPVEKIHGTRLDVWHGGQDQNVSHKLAEEMTGVLKGCKLHLLEDEAHVSLLVNYADQILDALLVLE
ncbi:hypothetical protein M409DRAFT_16067 [Zasmidium cellare ATCC 36951]|uniref:AB hydrolase-1 domain-containing protein n=1 Tax=Zasmidium cellare ATCC 36951 TaxID=1080233 RepID=A0A6A6D828_ZASCE|nr:uncharacterized protein M409DRAFT_16067 [Zasmidium cellare ATCC 36951]KAF2173796.1 hypothetical protein M409DRAFT_16067 [Zasmidium cellare ATCC 36951]